MCGGFKSSGGVSLKCYSREVQNESTTGLNVDNSLGICGRCGSLISENIPCHRCCLLGNNEAVIEEGHLGELGEEENAASGVKNHGQRKKFNSWVEKKKSWAVRKKYFFGGEKHIIHRGG